MAHFIGRDKLRYLRGSRFIGVCVRSDLRPTASREERAHSRAHQRSTGTLSRQETGCYEGLAFERLCREALPLIYRSEDVSSAFEVGEYWSKDVQIDIVGLREDNRTDLGECKWGAVRTPRKVEEELEERIRHFPDSRGATIGRRFFLRTRPPRGFPSASLGTWHDLESLYAL